MNKVVHFEIPADDLKRADEFYKGVFDWQIQSVPYDGGEYHMATTVATDENQMPKEPGAINGGLVQRGEVAKTPVLYVSVDNIDEAVKQVEAHGGKVVLPKKAMEGMGAYAQITDTEGNVLGLWEEVKK
jgi:predicted enzyme related to lactoylglutathione lyase